MMIEYIIRDSEGSEAAVQSRCDLGWKMNDRIVKAVERDGSFWFHKSYGNVGTYKVISIGGTL